MRSYACTSLWDDDIQTHKIDISDTHTQRKDSEDTVGKWSFAGQRASGEMSLTHTLLGLGFPSFRTLETNFCHLNHPVWCFVAVALTNQEGAGTPYKSKIWQLFAHL